MNDIIITVIGPKEDLTKGSVVILLNYGNNTFVDKYYFVGEEPVEIICEDINNDGLSEILVGTKAPTSVTVLQNINGSYINRTVFKVVGPQLFQIHILDIGDMNNDGQKDIIIGAIGLSVKIMFNENGMFHRNITINNSFSGNAPFSVPIQCMIDDYDNDSYNDISIFSDNTYWTIYYGDKDNNFTRRTLYTQLPRILCDVSQIDYHNDGDMDFILVNGTSLFLYENYGNGSLIPQKPKVKPNNQPQTRFIPNSSLVLVIFFLISIQIYKYKLKIHINQFPKSYRRQL